MCSHPNDFNNDQLMTHSTHASEPTDLFGQFQQTAYITRAKQMLATDHADELFDVFLACLLANLSDAKILNWYQQFVQTTTPSVSTVITDAVATTNTTEAGTADFWQKSFHVELKRRLTKQFMLPEHALDEILPVAVHQAFALLGTDGAQIVQTLHAQKALIKSRLPQWSRQVLSHEACAFLDNETPLANESTAAPSLDSLIDSALTDSALNDAQNGEQAAHSDFKTTNAQDVANHSLADSTEGVLIATPKPKGNPLLLALPILALVLGGGAWWYFQPKKQDAAPAAPQVATPQVQALPPALIRLTVGQSGELYACQAELGTQAASQQLLQLLQQNFTQSRCVIDINQGVNQNIQGFDKLVSVIGVLKTVSFASLELHGDTLYINAPNLDDVTRLVRDIGALMAGSNIKTLPMPPLQAATSIDESLVKAKNALTALAQNATDYEIARAMSLQILDVSNGEVPQKNLEVLKLAAERLKNNPNMRLIIVAHSDSLDRIATQTQADAIKNTLVGMGVAASQLVAQGVGTDFPIADNMTEIGRFKNRRVEFLVYDEPTMQALSQPVISQNTATMPAPTSAAPSGTQPTFAVQDGQIVEVPNGAPAPSTPNTAIPNINTAPTPPITEPGYVAPNHTAPSSAMPNSIIPNGITPNNAAPSLPSGGNSDMDELSKPIYSDPVGAPANELR